MNEGEGAGGGEERHRYRDRGVRMLLKKGMWGVRKMQEGRRCEEDRGRGGGAIAIIDLKV